jgi:hypothetical protein
VERLEDAADHLIAGGGDGRTDGVDASLPRMGAAWSISDDPIACARRSLAACAVT